MSDRQLLKDEVFLSMASSLAVLGTCDRARVGALIVKDGRCISWGYNGAPPGAPHCDENNHGWAGAMVRFSSGETPPSFHDYLEKMGCRNATHAEANAVAFAARQGISTEGGTLYVSHEPCRTCSMILVAAGIVKVFFNERYDRDSGQDLLLAAGVEAMHVPG